MGPDLDPKSKRKLLKHLKQGVALSNVHVLKKVWLLSGASCREEKEGNWEVIKVVPLGKGEGLDQDGGRRDGDRRFLSMENI